MNTQDPGDSPDGLRLGLPAVFAVLLVAGVTFGVLTVIAAALLVAAPITVPVAVIAIVRWIRRLQRRTPTLRRLIVLTTPFGLPADAAVRWSLIVAATMLAVALATLLLQVLLGVPVAVAIAFAPLGAQGLRSLHSLTPGRRAPKST